MSSLMNNNESKRSSGFSIDNIISGNNNQHSHNQLIVKREMLINYEANNSTNSNRSQLSSSSLSPSSRSSTSSSTSTESSLSLMLPSSSSSTASSLSISPSNQTSPKLNNKKNYLTFVPKHPNEIAAMNQTVWNPVSSILSTSSPSQISPQIINNNSCTKINNFQSPIAPLPLPPTPTHLQVTDQQILPAIGLQTQPIEQQLSALQYHLQREQTLNILRNGARFFDSRFPPIPLNHDSAAAAAAAAFFLQTAFRKPKRIRTAFTPSQLLKLENAFENNHYVVGQERKELAKSLNLTETQVKLFINV